MMLWLFEFLITPALLWMRLCAALTGVEFTATVIEDTDDE